MKFWAWEGCRRDGCRETVKFTRRRRQRLSHRPERWWPPFFGIHKVWSTSTTCRRAKRSQGFTMPNYCADSPPNCRTYGRIWRTKKCSSIMTTHRLTLPLLPRPNWSNWATNWATIFSRFGPVWLLFVSKLEKFTRWTEIWLEWGGRHRHRGQVYRAKKRLCWEINRHFSKIFFFFWRLSTYRTTLVANTLKITV